MSKNKYYKAAQAVPAERDILCWNCKWNKVARKVHSKDDPAEVDNARSSEKRNECFKVCRTEGCCMCTVCPLY